MRTKNVTAAIATFLFATAFASANAFADDDPCTVTQSAMSSLINSYIDAFKTCHELEQSHQTNSDGYKSEVTVAKEIESTYLKDAKFCNEVCADTTACNGPAPSGACQVRPVICTIEDYGCVGSSQTEGSFWVSASNSTDHQEFNYAYTYKYSLDNRGGGVFVGSCSPDPDKDVAPFESGRIKAHTEAVALARKQVANGLCTSIDDKFQPSK